MTVLLLPCSPSLGCSCSLFSFGLVWHFLSLFSSFVSTSPAPVCLHLCLIGSTPSSHEAPAFVLVLLSQWTKCPSFVSPAWSSSCGYFDWSHCFWTSCEPSWMESSWVEPDGWEANQARALVGGDVSVYHTEEPLLHEQKLVSPQRWGR